VDVGTPSRKKICTFYMQFYAILRVFSCNLELGSYQYDKTDYRKNRGNNWT